jgi:hypothetical protein
MYKFICIREQAGEGCDYTIGCGMDYAECEADSFEEAFEKFKPMFGWDDYEDGGYDYEYLQEMADGRAEFALASCVIYQVADERDNMYKDWLDAVVAKAGAEEEDKEAAARRQQYEELRKEFG